MKIIRNMYTGLVAVPFGEGNYTLKAVSLREHPDALRVPIAVYGDEVRDLVRSTQQQVPAESLEDVIAELQGSDRRFVNRLKKALDKELNAAAKKNGTTYDEEKEKVEKTVKATTPEAKS